VNAFCLFPACQLCCKQVLFLAASVCVSVRTKSRKLLVGNQRNLVEICPALNATGVWKLVTFDRELFSYFSNSGYTFWMALPSYFIFDRDTTSEYLGHGSVSWSWVQGQGHGNERAVACNSKTTGRKLLGIDRNICYELLTFDFGTYFWISSIQALSFEFLKLAASFSVWRYIFRIFRSPSSFKVIWLTSVSRSQISAARRFVLPWIQFN